MIMVGATAACTSAGAAERTFELVYQGFYAEHAEVFQPNKTLEVRIKVDDLNGDGNYSHDELVSLQSGIIGYYGSCGVINCVTGFSWVAGAEPSYFASYNYLNSFDYTSSTVYSGQEFTEFYQSTSGFRYDLTWTWTAATTATITEISLVPEPAQYSMLAVGLVGALALARRRRV